MQHFRIPISKSAEQLVHVRQTRSQVLHFETEFPRALNRLICSERRSERSSTRCSGVKMLAHCRRDERATSRLDKNRRNCSPKSSSESMPHPCSNRQSLQPPSRRVFNPGLNSVVAPNRLSQLQAGRSVRLSVGKTILQFIRVPRWGHHRSCP